MKAEILTIGDELLCGAVVDTNSAFLADCLTGVGVEVVRMTSVGDRPQLIVEELRSALRRADLVVVTGGLGPTQDDVTLEAASRALGRPLRLHPEFLEQMRRTYRRWGLEFREADARQAWLPEGAHPLPNPQGVCGFWLEEDGRLVVFLPGVPAEVQLIVREHLLPMLQGRSGQLVRTRVLKVFGLNETALQERLGRLPGDPQVSYLPSFPEVRVRLTVRGTSPSEVDARLEEAEHAALERLGIYVYGRDQETLEEVVGGLLRRRGLRLSLAESCTGGLVAHRITQVPGSSDYLERALVVYSVRSKVELLGIPPEVIERHGVVSAEVACWMARRVREISRTDLGLGITGVAGPGDLEGVPAGRVYIGLSHPGGVGAREYHFPGTRQQVKLMASQVALDRLRRYLLRA